MTEWSVELDARHEMADTRTMPDLVDDLLEIMRDHAAVASYDARGLSMRFCVTADSAESAVVRGARMFTSALRKAKIPYRPGIIRAEVETMAGLDARLRQPSIPDVIGIAELAKILGVTRQRASQIARQRDFPVPYARLASGPVWRRFTLGHFLERWPRKPGRPRRTKTPAAAGGAYGRQTRVLGL